MVDTDLEILKNSIIDLDFKGAEKAVTNAMNNGISPVKAIESVCSGLDVLLPKGGFLPNIFDF